MDSAILQPLYRLRWLMFEQPPNQSEPSCVGLQQTWGTRCWHVRSTTSGAGGDFKWAISTTDRGSLLVVLLWPYCSRYKASLSSAFDKNQRRQSLMCFLYLSLERPPADSVRVIHTQTHPKLIETTRAATSSSRPHKLQSIFLDSRAIGHEVEYSRISMSLRLTEILIVADKTHAGPPILTPGDGSPKKMKAPPVGALSLAEALV